ncbi:MAG: contractile injection system tape measure protein, partial [Pseudomonadota bacterium]
MSAASLVSRASFELDVDSVARGRAVQQCVSAFAHGRLPAVIDAVLADVAGGVTCVIERIELDLGQLSEATLETQLAEGVRQALMASLLRHGLGRRESGGLAAGDNGAASAGPPAWPALRAWMEGGGAAPPEAQMLRALRDSRVELLRLVRELGQRQAVRQRLARQLTRAALEQLVRALEPAEAQLIVDYVAQAGRLHRRRPLVPESRHSFSAALWEFVLSYLLLERGSYFDTRALVGHTLLLMARRYGVG